MTVEIIYKEYYGIYSKCRAIRYAKRIRSSGYPARVSKISKGHTVAGNRWFHDNI